MQITQKQVPRLPAKTSHRYGQFVEAVYSAWQPTLEKAMKAALPRLAAQDVIADREIQRSRSLPPSEVPSNVWVRMFERLLERNDDRVWQQLGVQHARLEADRSKLDRPSRTSRKMNHRRR